MAFSWVSFVAWRLLVQAYAQTCACSSDLSPCSSHICAPQPCERLADAYPAVTFLKLYGNANTGCKTMFKDFKVRSSPSFIFFRGGKIVETCTGASKQRLETTLRGVLRPEELPEGTPLYMEGEVTVAA